MNTVHQYFLIIAFNSKICFILSEKVILLRVCPTRFLSVAHPVADRGSGYSRGMSKAWSSIKDKIEFVNFQVN